MSLDPERLPRPIIIRRVAASVIERSRPITILPDIAKETAQEALYAVLLRIDRAVDGRYRPYREIDSIYQRVRDFESEARNELFLDVSHSDVRGELGRYFRWILPQNRRRGAKAPVVVAEEAITQGVRLLREGVTSFSDLRRLNQRAQQSRPEPFDRAQGEEFHTNPAGPPSTQRTSLDRREIIDGETPPDEKV